MGESSLVASDALDSRGVFFVPGFHGLQVLHFFEAVLPKSGLRDIVKVKVFSFFK